MEFKSFSTSGKSFVQFVWSGPNNETIISVSLYFRVPAIGQRPLFSAPGHSRWRVAFGLAVELSRLAQPDRHILWLQHQHGFRCRRREKQLRSNKWHLSMALIGDRLGFSNKSEACCPPTEHRQTSSSALSHSHCVAGHTNISTRVVLLCRSDDELSAQDLKTAKR